MGVQLAVDERLGAVSLPPAGVVSNGPIADAIRAFEDAKQQAVQARQASFDAERTARDKATQADAQLLADALAAGKPDPGTPNAEAADERLTSLRRHAQACLVLQERALDALRVVLDENADDWRREVQTELTIAGRIWQDQITALEQAHARITAAQQLIRFLQTGRHFSGGQLQPFVGRSQVALPEALAVLRGFPPQLSSELTTETAQGAA